jgi:hypothetical protein
METPTVQGLACMCCKELVPGDEGKFFAKVFCCSRCYTVATRVVEVAEQELRQLLVVVRESTRIALLEGKLEFKQSVETMSKKQLFEEIVRLDAVREAHLRNSGLHGKADR